jgi:hypothetical protein
MLYGVHYYCPECSQTHLAGSMVQYLESDLAGLPLTEMFRAPGIRFLCKIGECPSTKRPIKETLEELFLTITPFSRSAEEISRIAEEIERLENELPMAPGGIDDEE